MGFRTRISQSVLGMLVLTQIILVRDTAQIVKSELADLWEAYKLLRGKQESQQQDKPES